MKHWKQRLNFTFLVKLGILLLALLTLLCYCFANKLTPEQATIAGGALSAIATVLLGTIAIWQNSNYKKANDEANDAYIKPEFFIADIHRYGEECYDLPSLTIFPKRTQNSEGEKKELLCICKVLNYPIIKIHPKRLFYFKDNMITDYYCDFQEQTENELVLEKDKAFRIFISKYCELCDFELEVEYENIYGDTYTKFILFKAPQKSELPEASIFGTLASGVIKLRPAKNIKFKAKGNS